MRMIPNILILAMACSFFISHAQKLEVSARLDTTEILIGDQITFELKADFEEGLEVVWPILTDTLTRNVEILGSTLPDTLESTRAAMHSILQEFTITSFDSGLYRIPPVSFMFVQKGDSIPGTVSTLPLYLKVNTVEIDTTGNIKPIKPPLPAPYTLREALPWIGGIIAAGLITWLLIYYFKKRKKHQPLFVPRPKPKLPPHEIALSALEELRYKKLWQNNRFKDYYTEMTDILREYIEDRFHVPAVELTTEDILHNLTNHNINQEAFDKLRLTLKLADLVKFAKEKPLPLENDLSLNNSTDFVRETILKVEEGAGKEEKEEHLRNKENV